MSQIEFRPHRPGDLGWIIHRHGVIYAEEYGWGERLEGLVAKIMADFIESYDPARERFYIAERDGQFLGCVLICTDRHAGDGTTAKLRTFLVEPAARGMGVGKQLLRKCIEFAVEKGYARITLTTEPKFDSARRLYERAGFKVIGIKDCGDFAPAGSKEESWQLEL